MATLYLLRHAKSDWSDPSLRDHDRPLAPRGRRAAEAMADYMDEADLRPEAVLCSTAVRTRRTWALLQDRVAPDATVHFEEDLYGATAGEIVRVVRSLEREAERVLVVGHNPGVQVAALHLAGTGPETALARMRWKFPTAALAVLEADLPGWHELDFGDCRLDRFVRPKDLPGATDRKL